MLKLAQDNLYSYRYRKTGMGIWELKLGVLLEIHERECIRDEDKLPSCRYGLTCPKKEIPTNFLKGGYHNF